MEAVILAVRTLAAVVGAVAPHLQTIVDSWSDLPDDAKEHLREALAVLATLQRILDGSVDREDIAELEAPP